MVVELGGLNMAKGILRNGAQLNKLKNLVTNLGWAKDGYSMVNLDVPRAENYNIELEFENGLRNIRIDVNKKSTNAMLITPQARFGIFRMVVNLKTGANEFKLHGIKSEFASNLGNFKLSFIPSMPILTLPAGTYDAADANFDNGAILDISTNFVTEQGIGWNGYKTVTAYFTNYKVDNNRHCIFYIVFFGVLNVF